MIKLKHNNVLIKNYFLSNSYENTMLRLRNIFIEELLEGN